MDKGKKNKKQIIIGISVLLLVTLLLLGLTYAYYRTRIVGNTNSESISVTSKNLEVTYQDKDQQVIKEEGISPGYTKEKKFSVANTGDAKISYSIILDNKVNEFTRSEDWKYRLYKGEDKSNKIAEGTIAVGSEQVIYGKDEVDNEQTNNYILEIEYVNLKEVNQNEDMGHKLSFRVNIGEEKVTWDNAQAGTLLYAIKTNTQDMQKAPETTPGLEPSGENEKVLATTDDDYGTSHYFRGAVDNNYVTIGDSCWRIVRVQGDGSTKIILDDEQHSCTNVEPSVSGYITEGGKGSEYITTPYANPGSKSSARFETSLAKEELDNWYDALFTGSGRLSAYSNNVEQNAEWCNDLSETIEEEITHFGAWTRLVTVVGHIPTGPSLKCKSLNDKTDESIYTGRIGLLSADELVYSGYTEGGSQPAPTYLSAHGFADVEWTITPSHIEEDGDPWMFLTTPTPNIWAFCSLSSGAFALRPVIALRSDVKVSGSGTKETPYEITAN